MLSLVKDFTTYAFGVAQPGSLVFEPAILPVEQTRFFLFDTELFIFLYGHVWIILGKVENLPSIGIRLIRFDKVVSKLSTESCLADRVGIIVILGDFI